MASSDNRKTSPEDTKSNPLGAVARIYWMLLGYGILGLVGATIAKSGPRLSSIDIAYWAVVASILAVRYLDVAYLHGTTADGAPATMAHWRRHAGILTLCAAAGWAAAHGAGVLLV